MGANKRQVAGGHYIKHGDFQVWDAWWEWDMDAFEANIIKYVMRVKGDVYKRLEDLDKAQHYLQKYKELLQHQHDARDKQFDQVNKDVWNDLTLRQRQIVHAFVVDAILNKIVYLGEIENMVAAYKTQLLGEKEDLEKGLE